MNFSNYRITLDIQKSKTQASIPVHYKDTGNRLYITLTDGGNPYIIPDGCQAVFVANRPNPETNPPLINDCIIENNSVVRYDFNNNTASVEGMHKCEIRIIGPNHELITTPSFIMVVDQRVVYDDVIADDDEIAAITALGIIASEEARVTAENIRAQAETRRKEAEKERFVAEGNRNAAEQTRVEKENSRISFEGGRVTAEKGRVAAEKARETAENARASTMSRLSKQVSNLVSQINGELIVTDSDIAYVKEVPARSAPCAELTKFGGMSYRSENYIPFPYDFESINTPYHSVSIDSEQRLIVNGTTNYDYYYTLKEFHLPVGTYYLSAIQTSEMSRVYFYKNGEVFWSQARTDPEFRQFEVTSASDTYKVQLVVNPNAYKNDVVAPMISKDVPLTYSPYFGGLRHTKPTAFKSNGANLWSEGDIVANGYNTEIKNVFEALTPNKPYTLSWDYTSNGTESAQDVIIVYTGAGGFNIANGASFTITQEQINTFNIAYAYFGSNATSGSMTNIMLNEGEAALPYMPFREPITLAIPNINGLEYGVNANAYNYVDWKPDEGKKKYHKVLNKVILDGSTDEFWSIDGSYFKTVLTDISTIAGSVERAFAICDKYDATESVALPDKSFYCASTYYGYGSVVFKDSSIALDVDIWRAHIAANPITLIYTLNKPEVTDISDILTDDNFIAVEGGGTITAENANGYDIPSEITYQLRRAN